MKTIKLLTAEEIKELAESVGGVHDLSMVTGLRTVTLYRLIKGDYNPSLNTLLKLNILMKDLEKIIKEKK